MSAPEDVLRGLVHDLRTPLTLVSGFSDLLVRRADDLPASERDEYVRRIAEAAREMRELLARRPDLGVILYTGDSDAELLYDGLDSGARGYALKAGSMDELLAAIERVKEGGSYVDPRLDRILLSPRATAHVPQLSPREREIMHLMAEGRTAEAIADEISVSVETVRTHVRNVIRKLQARNRVHAIAIALERGEIALDHSGND